MSDISIAGRPIGPDHPPYIICELSGNHNGSLDRMLALADIVKVSDEDLSWIFKGDVSLESKAARLSDRHGCIVIFVGVVHALLAQNGEYTGGGFIPFFA